MIDFILIIYFMLSCFLTGLQFNEVKSEFNSKVTFVVTFVSIFISPIWYLYFLIIELFINFKNYFSLGVWYKYYIDKDYGKNFNHDTIYFMKNNKPKHRLEKILRKKLIERYEKSI